MISFTEQKTWWKWEKMLVNTIFFSKKTSIDSFNIRLYNNNKNNNNKN